MAIEIPPEWVDVVDEHGRGYERIVEDTVVDLDGRLLADDDEDVDDLVAMVRMDETEILTCCVKWVAAWRVRGELDVVKAGIGRGMFEFWRAHQPDVPADA